MAAVQEHFSKSVRTLYVSFELGWDKWKLAFATEFGENARQRNVTARCTDAVLSEIAKAKAKFGLPADAPVVCCFEAGRDGHWLPPFLTSNCLTSYYADSPPITVDSP